MALEGLEEFIAAEITLFHERCLEKVKEVSLKSIISRKNPYLFRAKNILTAQDLAENLIHAVLSSSEETIFGGRLEAIAIKVCELTYNGQKSPANGLDLDFVRESIRYLVSIKSGKNWGNSSQHKQQDKHFLEATKIVRQSKHQGQLQCVLGICYGKAAPKDDGIKLQLCGQGFWELISGDADFYKKLIEPIGRVAQAHDLNYQTEKAQLINRVTREILEQFSKNDSLDWNKILEFNSGAR
jgi:hypothetical protein